MAVSAQMSRAGARVAAAPAARKTVQTQALLNIFPPKKATTGTTSIKKAATTSTKKNTTSTKKAATTSTKKQQTADRTKVFKKSTGLEAPSINGKQFPIKLGFTKSNELFVGRLAMLGFASSLIGEILTGQGALAQFGYETGLTLDQVDEFILALIAFNFIAAILPASQTFVPEEQEAIATRPKGPLQDPTISILQPKKFFGVTGFGFSKKNELFVGRMAQLGFAASLLGEGPLQDPTISILQPKKFFGVTGFGFSKKNELFVGRMAQLGFAASLLGEAISGKGPLAQFGFETGIPVWEAEFGLVVAIVFLLFAAVNPGSGKFVDDAEVV